MIDLKEYVKKNRYLKEKKKTLLDLNTALENIKSEDAKNRKAGAKRLLSHATRSLGWNCLPVREWFLDETNKRELQEAIKKEKEDQLLARYLLAVCFFYDRYIVHPTWEVIFDKKTELDYKCWLKDLAEFHTNHKSSLVKKELENFRVFSLLKC